MFLHHIYRMVLEIDLGKTYKVIHPFKKGVKEDWSGDTLKAFIAVYHRVPKFQKETKAKQPKSQISEPKKIIDNG